MSNSERQATPQGKGSPVNFLMLVLVLFMIPLAVVITLAANPALPIVNPVYGCTEKLQGNVPGTLGGTWTLTNCITGTVLASGGDVGTVLPL